MKVIGAQFWKLDGPDAVKSYKVTFSVDETQREGILDLAKKVEKGTELILLVYEANKDEKEIKELVVETEEQTRTRLNRHMHALINDIAAVKQLPAEDIKSSLKTFLVGKKYIQKSSAELDLRGLAAAIFFLKTEYQYNQE